ncbi:MAG: tetratricopeptide repeat protein [Cytophagales bacterium]
MKKLIAAIALVVMIGACKKQVSQTEQVSASTENPTVTLPQKDYYLIRKIEQKEFPAGKSFKLEGRLKDQNDNTDFKNIELVLQDSLNHVIRRATVRPDGKFTFFKVEAHNYKLAIDTATMMSLLDKIKITKTEDYVKDEVDDHYTVGKKVSLNDIKTRFISDVYKDSLIKNNSNKIVAKISSKQKLPKILTYLLIDSKNIIIRRVEWASAVDLTFSQLYPKDYKIISMDPIPTGTTMKVKYVPNVQKEISKIDNFKLGDEVDVTKIKSYTSFTFNSDSVEKGAFKGILTQNGQPEDEGKLILLNSKNKVVHEVITSQTGGFNFENLEPNEKYTIIVPSKEKGYNIVHTNPKKKTDAIDELENQLLKRRSINEVLSQNNEPIIYEKEKVDLVMTRINSKLSENSNDAELLYKKGVLELENANYDAAVNTLEKAVSVKTDYGQAYYMLGEARDFMGDYEGAVQAYSKCIEYEPTNMAAFYKRGLVRKDIGEELQSNDDLTKVINSYPNYHFPYFYRGLARLQMDKYNEAIADFNKALVIEPKLSEAHFNKGYAYIHLKRPADAISSLNKSLELKPNDASCYLLRGQALSLAQKPNDAVKDFQEAIHLDPNLEVAYYEIAAVKFTQGDEATAHKMYDEAVNKFHSAYQPYYQRGVFYYNIKDYDDAKADLDKAASLNQEDPYVFYYRALINKQLKNKDLICADVEKALKLGYVDVDKSVDAMKKKYCD